MFRSDELEKLCAQAPFGGALGQVDANQLREAYGAIPDVDSPTERDARAIRRSVAVAVFPGGHSPGSTHTALQTLRKAGLIAWRAVRGWRRT